MQPPANPLPDDQEFDTNEETNPLFSIALHQADVPALDPLEPQQISIEESASAMEAETGNKNTRQLAAMIDIDSFDFQKPPNPDPASLTDRGMAMAEWKSLVNIDRFLDQVYQYYRGKGVSVILINRLLGLATLGFVAGLLLFLLYCIDWSFLYEKATASSHPYFPDVVHVGGIFKMPLFMMVCTLVFGAIWGWQISRLIVDTPRLLAMRRFYTHLLGISEKELATYAFQDVISKIVRLQREYPISIDQMNDHDIANRIMRRENYMIALFNKDVLDLSLPIPFFRARQTLTRTLEWNLSFCIINYIFDEKLTVRRRFLKDVQKDSLAYGLRKRFMLMGIVNLLLSPFIVIFFITYSILRYGEEFYKNPSRIGARQYTPFARWKFREFNELPHFFDRRLANSYSKASKYMNQFHNDILTSTAKFVTFVAGSIALVLLVITVINEDLLMHFEISPSKSVIWYVGFFGAILAVSRAMIPDDQQGSDPSKLMTEVVENTHYLPSHWRDRLHSEKVRQEFSGFFQYRLMVFAQELLSVVFTPFVLWFALPSCAEDIIEFFREFTVHVDGIGYVCSFAIFDFKRHANPRYTVLPPGSRPVDKYHRSKQGKMEKSFLNFKTNHPAWTPDELGSQFLERLRNEEFTEDGMTTRNTTSMMSGLEKKHGPFTVTTIAESDSMCMSSLIFRQPKLLGASERPLALH